MAQKKYHHGNLRPELLRTAATVIAQEGVEKLTMRVLSQQVGVSRTAAYRHFSDKTDLLCAVAEDGFKKLTLALHKVNQEPRMDSFQRFRKTGMAYIHFALSFPGYYQLMFGHDIIKRKRSARFSETVQATFNELLTSIETCRKEGTIHQGDPLYLANTVWAWAHGISMLLIDGQIDASGGIMPTLLAQDQMSDTDRIDEFIQASLDILTEGVKKQ